MGRPRTAYEGGLHTCSMCNATKEVSAFSYQNRASGKLQARCKECCSKAFKKYRDANPEKFREYKWHAKPENRKRREEQRRIKAAEAPQRDFERKRNAHLKATFGITSAQYSEMLTDQGGICAICSTDTPGRNSIYFHIDHCHDTGEVRGLLCNSCNIGLGHFKDNEANLNSAVEYLRKASK